MVVFVARVLVLPARPMMPCMPFHPSSFHTPDNDHRGDEFVFSSFSFSSPFAAATEPVRGEFLRCCRLLLVVGPISWSSPLVRGQLLAVSTENKQTKMRRFFVWDDDSLLPPNGEPGDGIRPRQKRKHTIDDRVEVRIQTRPRDRPRSDLSRARSSTCGTARCYLNVRIV